MAQHLVNTDAAADFLSLAMTDVGPVAFLGDAEAFESGVAADIQMANIALRDGASKVVALTKDETRTEVARHAVAEKVANSVIGQLTKTKAAIEAKAESLGYLGQAQASALFSPKDGRAALDGEIRSWIRESMKTADGISEVMAAARSDGNVAAVIYHSPRFLLGLSNETHASLKFDAIKRFAPEAYAHIENSGKLFDLAPRYDRVMQKVRMNFYNQTLADKAKLRVEV